MITEEQVCEAMAEREAELGDSIKDYDLIVSPDLFKQIAGVVPSPSNTSILHYKMSDSLVKVGWSMKGISFVFKKRIALLPAHGKD